MKTLTYGCKYYTQYKISLKTIFANCNKHVFGTS